MYRIELTSHVDIMMYTTMTVLAMKKKNRHKPPSLPDRTCYASLLLDTRHCR